jgi:hypothetical protein
MLWNREFAVAAGSIRRRIEYRVLGSIGGQRFWAYFPNALVFPGPDVSLRW